MTSAPTKPTPAVLAKRATTTTPTWPQRVAELAANPDLALAPLLGGAPELRDGRWQLHPYLVRRDVTALIGWAEQLEEFPQSAHLTPLPYEGLTVPVTQISVIGVLLGEVVELLAVTHRQVSRGDQDVAWDVLLELVDAERRDLEPVLDDVVLSAWDVADPLFTGTLA